MTPNPILLTSRAAIRCARRTHNDFDPTLDDSQWVEVETTRWATAGIDFEVAVREHLRVVLGADALDLSDLAHAPAIERTSEAMAAGVPVILGGALLDDPEGARRGRPDLLICTGPRPDGTAGYLPADIKSHTVSKAAARGHVLMTPLAQLAGEHAPQTLAGRGPNGSHRLRDLMQLAHYWRMLQASGHASHLGSLAGLIGSDTFSEDPWLLWQSLDEPAFTTYSRSHGSAKRSALERYDHEFGFRVRIAEAARTQSEPLVRPIIIEECDSCPWHEVCLDMAGELEPSRHITTGRLGVREWNALHARGVRTLPDLAALSLTDARLDGYWSEVEVAEPRARQRLIDASTRAQMVLAGERLRRITDGPIDVPRADVEVDFDIEWDADGRIYLWGLLVTDSRGERLETLAEWDELHDEAEAGLAAAAVGALVALRDEALAAGRTFAVYHYSHPEVSMVRSLLARGGTGLPTVAEWDEFTQAHFVDLWGIVKAHYIGVKGLGLKQVAPWAGFEWQDDDPSGEASMEWVEQVRHAEDPTERRACRDRLLQYNTDDVRATLAVRRMLAEEGLAQPAE